MQGSLFKRLERRRGVEFLVPDGLLVSYPKSGRTWLRMILAKLIAIRGFDHEKFELIPALHKSPEYIAENYSRDARVVFLHRNPGDVVVSYYAEKATSVRSGEVYGGTISEFIRDPELGIRAILAFNTSWRRQLPEFAAHLVISYEDLHDDIPLYARRIVDFLGFEYEPEELLEAIAYADFGNMQKIERGEGTNYLEHYKGSYGKSVGRVRKGKVDAFRSELSADDVAYIEEMMRAYDPQP